MHPLPRLLPLLVLASCAGFGQNMQGPVDPQAFAGPCSVSRFYLLSFLSVPTTMVVRNTGEACSFVVVNPALNVPLNAALLTRPAAHGQAATDLVSGARQAAVAYTPQPGYAGPDEFAVTIEPNAIGITVHVRVE